MLELFKTSETLGDKLKVFLFHFKIAMSISGTNAECFDLEYEMSLQVHVFKV